VLETALSALSGAVAAGDDCGSAENLQTNNARIGPRSSAFALQRWIGSSEDDARLVAEGANIRPQGQIYFAKALRTVPSTLLQNLTNIRACHAGPTAKGS
jgi:hypothetical protein